nr:IS66 family transposase [Thioalkalivibrio nitratireducens]
MLRHALSRGCSDQGLQWSLCTRCGRPTSGSPGLEVRHTKHVYLQRQCSCGHWTHAEPGRCAENTDWQVELTEWHLAGPMLVALICALSLRQRVSRRGVQEFLADWLGVSLSIAAIHQCLHEAGRAVAPVIERDIVPLIREAELLHVDETGWKEGNQLLWLWVFTCTTATLFAIGRRSRRMLHKILGEAFVGWLMSDGFWAYRDYDRRLRCLAHLIRKAHGLDQSLDPLARPFGAATLALFEDLLQQVYQAREGPQPPADLYQKNRGKLDAFNDLCVDHWDCAHEKTRQLAREFTHDWEAIWAVLEFPRLPITNNWAEQALRHWVISRRISQGTRTEQGSLAFALLVSVIETCRKRGVSPWPYLAQVVQQRRKGEPAPVLPEPAPAP